MALITRLYESQALKASRGTGHRKAQAHHRAERVGTKAGAVTVMRPDADGHLRECSVERSAKRVRWDVAGLFVECAPKSV